jgi:hypothetical protein
MSDFTLTPSPARRASAAMMLAALGALLVWVATRPEAVGMGWIALLLAMAVLAFAFAWLVWRATGRGLVLTEEALIEEGGRVLCRLDDISAVERGTFAFKPSNGFMIRLKTGQDRPKYPRAWVPGLWWRLGHRIGVGGVTPAGQGKAMADVIAARLSGAGRIE